LFERTLILIKPDGVRRGLIGSVISRLERKGLRIVALEMRTLDRVTAEQHYAEHEGKPFFPPLLEFITSGRRTGHHPRRPCVASQRERRAWIGLTGIGGTGNQDFLPGARLAGLPLVDERHVAAAEPTGL
jgi:hypothetical protein